MRTLKTIAAAMLTAALAVLSSGQSQTAKAEPATFILQCDGEATANSGNDLRRYIHRFTVQFDLAAETVLFWNDEKRSWSSPLPGVKASLEISPARLVYRENTVGELGGYSDTYIFNRTLGTLSFNGNDTVPASSFGPEVSSDNTFEGHCVKVDAPSTETAF